MVGLQAQQILEVPVFDIRQQEDSGGRVLATRRFLVQQEGVEERTD